MNPEYERILVSRKRFRVLEKRSRLLKQFVSEHKLAEPKSIPHTPLLGCGRLMCFVNVEKQVTRMGGRMQTGFLFKEFEDICIRTVAHAVWINPQGRWLDITPYEFAEQRVLFSPDNRVALKRGFTAGFKTILSQDSKIRAVEVFTMELAKILERDFKGFGIEHEIETKELKELALTLNLPQDVAHNLFDYETASRLAPI